MYYHARLSCIPIHLITSHPFFCPLLFIAFYFVLRLFKKGPKPGPWILPAALLLFVNVFAGHCLNVLLIHKTGETGEAKMTGSHATSTQYNNHDVMRHDVLLKTQSGHVVETSFRDDDFNVYPFHNSVTYPQEGDVFHVSYLKHFPTAFIIISNDSSPWANDLKCRSLHRDLLELRRKYEFDRSNKGYQDAYIKMIQLYILNHCYTDSIDLKKYDGDMDYIRQGKDLDAE